MKKEISSAVSIPPESILEDLATFFVIKFKEWHWQKE